jgi:hypothetical protein
LLHVATHAVANCAHVTHRLLTEAGHLPSHLRQTEGETTRGDGRQG